MPIQIETLTPERKEGPVVGIDLGTTNSLVAIVEKGRPRILKSREGKHLIPSVVSFADNGKPVIGNEAKRKKVRDAQHTVFSVKRLLGRNFEDLQNLKESFPFEIVPQEGVVRIRIGERAYTAIEISALI